MTDEMKKFINAHDEVTQRLAAWQKAARAARAAEREEQQALEALKRAESVEEEAKARFLSSVGGA